ncbi:hypothetical protein D7S86_28840 [Pararobbsia silviterrae]|uniref:Uncharacterized protein n=1 Tax=Pararobbsia silviterrae TaxID=1792498 RepID=A0A494WZE8_9BURK|nr:hypothetical protein D7S86_28840 [Pararobbsia silviterrae]
MASACDLVPFQIAGDSGKAGPITIGLGEPDNVAHPTAWQGPLTISTASTPTCTVSDAVSIIERPIVSARGVLFVQTYSGSTHFVYAVDASTCAVIWRSDGFAGTAIFGTNTVVVGAKTTPLDQACHPE